MSIPTEAAKLPTPPAGKGFQATFNSGPSFTGDVDDDGAYYAATLTSFKVVNSKKYTNNDGSPKKQIQWNFTLDDQKDAGELPWFTSFSMNEKSKLPDTLDALGHATPTEENPTIDPESCIGRPAKVFCEKVQKEGYKKAFVNITKVKAPAAEKKTTKKEKAA